MLRTTCRFVHQHLNLGCCCLLDRDFPQLMEMQREMERAIRSRTWLGHLQNLFGYITSAFCLFK